MLCHIEYTQVKVNSAVKFVVDIIAIITYEIIYIAKSTIISVLYRCFGIFTIGVYAS